MSLPVTSWKRFARELHDGRIEQICILSDVERMTCEAEELNQLISEGADALSAKSKKERFDEQGWDSLKASSFYKVLREYKDVLPDDIPAELPQDKGVQHEIDLVPGTKYCVTRQWPLPREQVKAIDDFFESRRKAGQVRESKSPHSAPTFCVKKRQGGWRIVHAYNKLNDATVPAQTPIPRKDVIIDSMTSSTIFSTLDLRDGFYQILMRESDIPLAAVSTPSSMLCEWLVMPQGLKNAPATFNRCVTHLLRSVRDFAPSYFDDVFIHSRAVNGKSDVEMHTEHLRKLLELMRKHKLYANLKKCIFGATEILILGYLVGENGELRQFLGLTTYLCKYVSNYAGKIRPLSQLLKKEAAWEWTADCQQAFEAVKQGLTEAPILAVADQDRPFHVVEYKPGRLNVVADALSRRPDYAVQAANANAVGVVRTTTPSSSLLDDVKAAYAHDADAKQLLDAVDDNADRIVVPDDHELKLKITTNGYASTFVLARYASA
uniref:Reverse transcriptase domain-containing protein n=1 Tax=Phytophthora ramorum TaxID=164328 RepID=H3H650_PHYRM